MVPVSLVVVVKDGGVLVCDPVVLLGCLVLVDVLLLLVEVVVDDVVVVVKGGAKAEADAIRESAMVMLVMVNFILGYKFGW